MTAMKTVHGRAWAAAAAIVGVGLFLAACRLGYASTAPDERAPAEPVKLYPVREDGRLDAAPGAWGYIDSKGQWIIAPKFERSLSFSDSVTRHTPP